MGLQIRTIVCSAWVACVCFLSAGLAAQSTESTLNKDALDYIAKYKDLAMREMERTGIPASITLAQGLFESGFGKSQLSTRSNNHFGIKCKSAWQGEKVYHDDDEKGECFRKYNTVEESYVDHSDFLVNNSRYKDLFGYGPDDYKSWAHGLKKAGYATNPLYAKKLIEFIEKYQLDQYTLSYWAKVKNDPNHTEKSRPIAQQASIPESGSVDTLVEATQYTAIPTPDHPQVLLLSTDPGIPDTTQVLKKKTWVKASRVYDKFSVGELTSVNRLPAIVLPKGFSLLKVAEMNQISLSNIYRYNDLIFQESSNDLLSRKMLIYLAPKRFRGSEATHILRQGESLHDVSQLYGIKLSRLLQLNRLKLGETPSPNQTLYLRRFSPTKPNLEI